MSGVVDERLAERSRPRRRIGLLAVAALVLLAVMAWVWWSFFALREEQGYRVLFSAGTVAAGDAASGATAPARGTRLATGDDGYVTVQLADGTVLKLMPGTSLDMEDARANATASRFSIGLRLISGEVETRVPADDGARRELNLFSSSVAIGVRGTEFTVQEEGRLARLMVTRGRVEAGGRSGAAVTVAADQGTVVRAGEPVGEVTALPPPPQVVAPPKAVEAGLEFAWDDPGGQPAYLVEIAEDEAFDRLLRHRRVDWRRGTLPALERDGRYFWRVAAIDARGLRGRYTAPGALDQDYYLRRGRAALQRLDPEAVRANLARSLAGLDPEIDALRQRGEEALRAGDTGAARATLGAVLGLRPDDQQARIALARAEFLELDYAAARADYRRALAGGEPAGQAAARVGIALIDVRQGRFRDGLDGAAQVLADRPRHLGALKVAAMASVGLGDRASAAEFVHRALEVDPGDATAAALARSLQQAPALPGAGS